MEPTFLYSIDLEDIRRLVDGGDGLAERVPENTERFLAFFDRHGVRVTFFTTGDVARRYPDLVRRIAASGHEIACHSSDHLPLDRHDPRSLREDLKRCLDDFDRADAGPVTGFRAPIGSLTAETRWAYAVLQELGFHYSSSVLAARNPLYGWPEFGPDRARREAGLWEIPMTLSGWPGLRVPFAGGVYLRVLPFALVRHWFRRRLAAGDPIAGYAHPYDIDVDQEAFMFPEINDSRFYNWLMYRNRDQVFPRLEKLFATGVRVTTYRDFVDGDLADRAAHA